MKQPHDIIAYQWTYPSGKLSVLVYGQPGRMGQRPLVLHLRNGQRVTMRRLTPERQLTRYMHRAGLNDFNIDNAPRFRLIEDCKITHDKLAMFNITQHTPDAPGGMNTRYVRIGGLDASNDLMCEVVTGNISITQHTPIREPYPGRPYMRRLHPSELTADQHYDLSQAKRNRWRPGSI